MNIVTLIPARGGSKGIKNKNIVKIKKKPLIYYSVKLARQISNISDFFVSTDSLKIKKVLEDINVNVPFLRPKKYATDKSSDLDVMRHFYKWYKSFFKKDIDLLIHLRPTTPFRKASTVRKAINIMINNPSYDSLRSFVESNFSGYKMWLKENNKAKPLIKTNKKYHSMGRQFIPKTYCHVGYVDILRPKKTIQKKSMVGKKTFFFKLNKLKEYHMDIDNHYDLKISRSFKIK